jgi:hypothetical protein
VLRASDWVRDFKTGCDTSKLQGFFDTAADTAGILQDTNAETSKLLGYCCRYCDTSRYYCRDFKTAGILLPRTILLLILQYFFNTKLKLRSSRLVLTTGDTTQRYKGSHADVVKVDCESGGCLRRFDFELYCLTQRGSGSRVVDVDCSNSRSFILRCMFIFTSAFVTTMN